MLDVTFLFFSFSRNDAINFLMNTEDNSDIESFSDEDDHDLAMLPPMEKTRAETDMESDEADDMNHGLVHHLPRRLLNSTCDSSFLDKGNYALNPLMRNQENQQQETGKKALHCCQF